MVSPSSADDQQAASERTAMQDRVAAEYDLPPLIAKRLQGSSEWEMRRDAEHLTTIITNRAQPRPRGDIDQGAKRKPPPLPARDAFADLIHRALSR